VTDDGTALIDSTLILEYLAGRHPAVAALIPSAPADRLRALRVAGLALIVMEKAVQRHYERALRPAEKQHQPWVDRILGQLHEGLAALDRELPKTGWIASDLGLADIAAACAYGFTVKMVGDVVDVAPYPNLAAFSARAEALPAFRAAPAEDGVAAPVAVQGGRPPPNAERMLEASAAKNPQGAVKRSLELTKNHRADVQ
jgi:glutathione S-transferase